MERSDNIGAVITAAGMSTRMKAFKQTLPIGHRTMAEHVVARFQSAGADPIVVVTGFRAKEVREVLSGYPVTFLENPDYESTQMFDTVSIGLDYIRERCARVFLTPVDVPLFSVETLEREIAAGGDIIIPVEEGVTGHPVLIDTKLIPEILRYSGERGLRGAMEESAAQITYLEVHDRGAFIDADTREAYGELLRLYTQTEDNG